MKNLNNERLHETRMMNCGMECTIIRYVSGKNIDVQFKDGTIITNRYYKNFINGSIYNPNLPHTSAVNHIGEKQMMNCGMKCEIIAYRKEIDIDVRFEDGTVVKNKGYSNFHRGAIRNPNLPSENPNHNGEMALMNCGMKCTIIEYRNWDDITVQFEDGTIIPHRSYQCFIQKHIHNPNLPKKHRTPNDRTGKTNEMNCGMKCTIIAYRNARDIDVQFTDSTIIAHRKYRCFINGCIYNPNLPYTGIAKRHKDETNTMNCGIECKIIKYNSRKDIDIEFTDGTIVSSTYYSAFKWGIIKHPLLKLFSKTNSFKHPIYQTETKKYFVCKCRICQSENILTPLEMVEHIHTAHPDVAAEMSTITKN